MAHSKQFYNNVAAAAAAKSLQLCPTRCDPMDCSPPGSSVHGIFQARVLEWGAIAFSKVFLLLLLLSRISRVGLRATPQTAAYQAPLSLGFSRQEYLSGLPFPSPMHERKDQKKSFSHSSEKQKELSYLYSKQKYEQLYIKVIHTKKISRLIKA